MDEAVEALHRFKHGIAIAIIIIIIIIIIITVAATVITIAGILCHSRISIDLVT
jgi:flagellar basal body-associated protein FliL